MKFGRMLCDNHSALRYDSGRKAKFYASHGVKELWAIDVEILQTHIFTKPKEETGGGRGGTGPKFRAGDSGKMGELELVLN